LSYVLFGAALVAVSAYVGRWRLLFLPAAVAGIYIVGAAASGAPWQDTPVLFLAFLAEAAIAIGVLAKRAKAKRL
jgi:hypothetical protein